MYIKNGMKQYRESSPLVKYLCKT